jgi:hypothetical protein
LVPTIPQHTIFIQTIHIEVTTPTASELWTFQDGAGIPLTRPMSAAAVAHFDFDFGPDGVPCSEATAFMLNITGAIGAVGWITWAGYRTLPVSPPNYAAVVLADQPLGFWRFGELSGTVARDSSGHGYAGTYVGSYTQGAPSLITDPNPALALSGASQNGITLAGIPQPALMSMEAWLRLATVQIGQARIYACGAAFDVLVDAARQFVMYVNFVEGATGFLTTGVVLPALTPVHVVTTWDGTAVRAFVNGGVIYTNTTFAGRTLTGIGATTQLKSFGCVESGAGADLIGVIDECALYAAALSPDRIARHSQAGR